MTAAMKAVTKPVAMIAGPRPTARRCSCRGRARRRRPWSASRERTRTRPRRACRRRGAGRRRWSIRTARCGDHREALDEADAERLAQRNVHRVVVFRLQRPAIDPEQDETAEDQHDADQHRRLEQDRLDEAVRQRADDGGGQEGEQDREDEAARPRIGREFDQEPGEARGVDAEDREDRAELDQHLEGLARRFEAEEMAGEQDMPVDETGMNSVSPSRMPRSAASMIVWSCMSPVPAPSLACQEQALPL